MACQSGAGGASATRPVWSMAILPKCNPCRVSWQTGGGGRPYNPAGNSTDRGGVWTMPRIVLADAESPLVLSLDMGTSSVRALLFDRLGRAVDGTEEQCGYDLRTTPDGGAEADAESLFALLLGCIDGSLGAAVARVAEIGGVGVSCFWHSLLGLDGDGNAITPIYYWADTRSVRQVDALRREIDVPAMHARTGCPLHSSFWPAKLRWVQRDDAGRVRAGGAVVLVRRVRDLAAAWARGGRGLGGDGVGDGAPRRPAARLGCRNAGGDGCRAATTGTVDRS